MISEVKLRATLILPKADSTRKNWLTATQKYPMNRTTSPKTLKVPKEDLLLARENESRTTGKEPKIVSISIWSKRVRKQIMEANSKR